MNEDTRMISGAILIVLVIISIITFVSIYGTKHFERLELENSYTNGDTYIAWGNGLNSHKIECYKACDKMNLGYLSDKQVDNVFADDIDQCYCTDGDSSIKVWGS